MKSFEIECSSCAKRNRVEVDRASAAPERVRCGGCGGRMFRGPEEPLTDIDADEFVHPLDRKALSALRHIPGVESVLKRLLGEVGDRRGRILHLSTCVRIGEGQLPELLRLYERAGARLGVASLPDLFLYQSPIPQAYLLGVDAPVMAVSSGLLDLLEEDELLGVMGHELTHWLCSHALYRTAAILVAALGASVLGGLVPGGRAILTPMRLALLEWSRSSELSADRGELLVTGSLDTSIRTLLKLAGGSRRYGAALSVEAFMEQAARLEEEEEQSFVGKAMSFWMGMQATHPFAVWRAHHLQRFARSPEYFEILAGRYRKRLPAA
ncbi:MAG: hypothetical protein AMXMBFR64_01320 [Myxococcales bacterium]